eukprot:scaffold648041_cov31-Prasinocladus_malaysianus.AAC.1
MPQPGRPVPAAGQAGAPAVVVADGAVGVVDPARGARDAQLTGRLLLRLLIKTAVAYTQSSVLKGLGKLNTSTAT